MKLVFALPVYNEEKILDHNVRMLYDFLMENFSSDSWKLIIADNLSTDRTSVIAQGLAAKFSHIQYLPIPMRGKGIAIRTAWQSFDADCFVFMDADLATDISALPKLVTAVTSGQCDVASGSRYHPQSIVERSWMRVAVSRCYRAILRAVLGLKLQDAPCGFKAINTRVKQEVMPRVQNNEWFFDNELVILAEKMGYRVCEIPITWREQSGNKRKSKVSVLRLSWEYMKKIIALRARIRKKI